MSKDFKFFFLLTAGIFLAIPFSGASALTADSAHKAIVKIYTYYENENYLLNLAGSGSGVIIGESGIVLTNHHVVTAEDEFEGEIPAAYKICLTENTTDEPDCSFSADLLAKDKDKDIALLKIKNVPGLSTKTNFSYLKRAKESGAGGTGAVKAIGYPGIGGETITTTTGTISGTTEKYSLSWFKTDADFSFGSSGGALIGENGDLLGITTMAHYDMLGSLGYVLDIAGINGWIDSNMSKAGQLSSLQDRTNSLIVKQKSLKTSDIFQNDKPNITVIKNANWNYEYNDETALKIKNSLNGNGGSVAINWSEEAVAQDNPLDFQSKVFKLVLRNYSAFMPDQDIVFSGKQAKKITQNLLGQEIYTILAPSKNYLVSASYSYGEKEVDKQAIDEMLNKIIISDAGNNFQEKKTYEHTNPYFRITLPSGWALKQNNSEYNPVSGSKSAVSEISFSVMIKKLTENMQTMNNEEYFNYFKDNDLVASDYESALDLTSDRYYESTNYKINEQLNNEIFYKYRFKDENDGNKIKANAAGFRIMYKDRVIVIKFDYIGENEAMFEEYLNNFQNNVLVNFMTNKISAPSPSLAPAPSPSFSPAPTSPISKLAIQIKNMPMYKNLKGKIMLKVESVGEAYYIHPTSEKMYYLGRPDDAFSVMREQGVGITNVNLEKIPIGLNNLTGTDSDSDGLPDLFEDAIGTNENSLDSDGDGYNDKMELEGGYNPSGAGKLNTDNNFSGAQKGKIFLQVERNGEAWYINPADGKRYFLGRPADAFAVMRNLGLGISNKDFDSIK